MRYIILFLFLVATQFELSAQDSDSLTVPILVKGSAENIQGLPIGDLLIINDATYTGTFGKPDGSFYIKARKKDTLIFGSVGYTSVKVCYADSALKPVYELKVVLEKIRIALAETQVIAEREMIQIQRDIAKLGYKESDYRATGWGAAASPITFLYEEFSKRERSKREVAQLENEDRKRELLKELFKRYVDYEIIELTDEEFDDFIDFINVSESFLQRSTQYDFILYVKDRFEDYKIMRRNNNQLREDDYYYDED